MGLGGFLEGGCEEVGAAFEDRTMASSYAGDGEVCKVADTGDGGGAIPGGKFGEREVPRAEAGDVRRAADGDEGVPGIEGAITLVEIAEVAWRVAGGGKAAEGAKELAGRQEVGGGRFGAGEAALELAGRFAWIRGEDGRLGE
jgi:hypothetical protein